MMTTVLPKAIALQLPMEAALAQMVQRDVERVRFHVFTWQIEVRLSLTLCPFIFFYTLSDLENNILGWCDRICCNATTEQTCYDWDEVDDNGNPEVYCAAITDGGCPESSGAGEWIFVLLFQNHVKDSSSSDIASNVRTMKSLTCITLRQNMINCQP
jgi:hypothetical protein